ncbi:MAG: hypothetical protein QF741_04690 [Candidatus Peribacteraceae bacterium]|jgi:hypothetical protein|nr:hypothetical protein [Candidatus Peribacteraceae bacterium]MDP7454357.1 hypothetical protein [Candidatus Peribacteraceae bacterium]MDP7645575.1 hypothetical protein [Candidatus Peribacteraceae bacterium]|tara:strand:+ start:1218 stop:1700 length:483 start_codon:yes stop_codon:yes gene_type:complete
MTENNERTAREVLEEIDALRQQTADGSRHDHFLSAMEIVRDAARSKLAPDERRVSAIVGEEEPGLEDQIVDDSVLARLDKVLGAIKPVPIEELKRRAGELGDAGRTATILGAIAAAAKNRGPRENGCLPFAAEQQVRQMLGEDLTWRVREQVGEAESGEE